MCRCVPWGRPPRPYAVRHGGCIVSGVVSRFRPRLGSLGGPGSGGPPVGGPSGYDPTPLLYPFGWAFWPCCTLLGGPFGRAAEQRPGPAPPRPCGGRRLLGFRGLLVLPPLIRSGAGVSPSPLWCPEPRAIYIPICISACPPWWPVGLGVTSGVPPLGDGQFAAVCVPGTRARPGPSSLLAVVGSGRLCWPPRLAFAGWEVYHRGGFLPRLGASLWL